MALLVIFVLLVVDTDGMTASDAYEVVKGPLMALIGGSLAISKDLIPLAKKDEVDTDAATEQETGGPRQ